MNLQNVLIPTEAIPLLLFADIPGSQGPDPTFPSCLPSLLCRCKSSRKKEKNSKTQTLGHNLLMEISPQIPTIR